MLSKNKIKYIRSLELKKNRKEEHAFLAEGNKLVNDLINHFSCQLLVATKEWLQSHPHLQAAEIIEVTHEELSRASLLKNPAGSSCRFRATSLQIRYKRNRPVFMFGLR
mgnify:CR=1 FL=1